MGNNWKQWQEIIAKNPTNNKELADDFIAFNTWNSRISEIITRLYPEKEKSSLKDKISIVILNYNNKDIIVKSLNSLLKYNELGIYTANVNTRNIVGAKSFNIFSLMLYFFDTSFLLSTFTDVSVLAIFYLPFTAYFSSADVLLITISSLSISLFLFSSIPSLSLTFFFAFLQ